MYSVKTLVTAAVATMFAGQALGIASDPYYACNCPNNCSHELGSSCKYFAGPSDNAPVVSGKCTNQPNDYLMCVPT
ncbi:uncharacterized protein B0I36DRAFT_359931 [Microdochium trichocladiopsis]|uniref:Uncharacterized protein n=1 Tax=Microdochium trichocladiopsis TaxID=1682393 RepID=A0A9P8YHP6_9PEZI|nr:uncharacterized protein B0I36DRAFT_359931 [Microdochium trichocladiopsis]KAH7038355.1 hypothetical protein B0I36DRAFT_359931 [Microdochium trichocladiopsis]